MKVRKVTIEIEVPWNATFQTVLYPRKLDGDGLLHALRVGMGELYDGLDPTPPCQTQVVSAEVSTNKQIGVFTEWPLK